MATVVGFQRLVVEGRDLPGITSGVEPVRSGWKQGAIQSLLKLLLGLAHQAEHLAQNHAAPHRRLPFLSLGSDLDAAPFLVEVQPVEARKEGRIDIDREQILVICEIAGGEVVGSAVLGSQRVHGRAQGAAQHREEGAPAGKTLTAAHDQMFQDVSETTRIRGGGEEGHQEGTVLDWHIDVKVSRAGRHVNVLRELAVQHGNTRTIQTLEARSDHSFSLTGARGRAFECGSEGPFGIRRDVWQTPRRCRRSLATHSR